MGVRKPCSELFHTAFIDLGLCCSFNILPEVLVHDKPFEKEEKKDEVHFFKLKLSWKGIPCVFSAVEPSGRLSLSSTSGFRGGTAGGAVQEPLLWGHQRGHLLPGHSSEISYGQPP